MRGHNTIWTLWEIIGISIFMYAIVINNLWAEPDPPKPAKIEPVIVIKEGAAYTELEQELAVSEIKKGKEEQEEVRGEMKAGELELLAACVEAEAGNQSLLGKRLVVDVILNRQEDPDFPDSVQGVIEAPGQFDVVRLGSIKKVEPTEDTWNAVYAELTGIKASEDVLYFRTKQYSKYGEPLACVGDHYFSGRERK